MRVSQYIDRPGERSKFHRTFGLCSHQRPTKAVYGAPTSATLRGQPPLLASRPLSTPRHASTHSSKAASRIPRPSTNGQPCFQVPAQARTGRGRGNLATTHARPRLTGEASRAGSRGAYLTHGSRAVLQWLVTTRCAVTRGKAMHLWGICRAVAVAATKKAACRWRHLGSYS